MRESTVYRALQRHLDRQPIGFPATFTGAERRLLKHFFTPDEARIAIGLTYRGRTAGEVCKNLKEKSISLKEVEERLSDMAAKGSIGYKKAEGRDCYYLIPLVIGMYETHLNDLSPAFIKDFKSYTASPLFGMEFIGTEVPQMRTIPVEESITPELSAASYENIYSLLEASTGPIVVNECICRKKAALEGEPCRRTGRTETCLAFGDIALLCRKMNAGRTIDKAEALRIIRQNEEDGLVLQPSNSQKLEYVCSCCGCCCGMLHIHQELAHPLAFWATNYFARIDCESCTGCGICTDVCQVGAAIIPRNEATAAIDRSKCIGCGNCVVRCPCQAISLEKKATTSTPPLDMDDLYETIMAHKKSFLEKLVLGLKILLKINPKPMKGE